jgi:hypothetical protein
LYALRRQRCSRTSTRTRTARLGRYGLVKPSPDGPIMHRLTQAVLTDQLDPHTHDRTRALAEHLLAAATPPDATGPAKWPAWASLLPHLLTPAPDTTNKPQLRALAERATL